MASSTEPARSPSPGSAPGILLSAADVARVVDRMAHQLIERAAATDPGGPDGGLSALVLVGILAAVTGGTPEAVLREHGGKGFSEFEEVLSDALVAHLS